VQVQELSFHAIPIHWVTPFRLMGWGDDTERLGGAAQNRQHAFTDWRTNHRVSECWQAIQIPAYHS
jgi:hypothetical protein